MGHSGAGEISQHGASVSLDATVPVTNGIRIGTHVLSRSVYATVWPVLLPTAQLGANAALLLYDITNASTFNDIRGWLEGALSFSC